MNIKDILQPDMIIAELKSKTQEGVIGELAHKVASCTDLQSNEIEKVLLEREKLGSTGLESGIAIPHGKVKNLKNVIACFARSTSGVDFNALDGGKSHLFFMLLAPEKSAGAHLKALARVSRLAKNQQFRKALLKCGSAKEIYSVIEKEDAKD